MTGETISIAAPGAAYPQSVSGAYVAPPVGYDEFVAPDGAIRPHWRDLARFIDGLSATERKAAEAVAERLFREHGATYVLSDDAGEGRRPWQLDLLPFVIGIDEWRRLEQGLVQRANLLNAILADLHGEQRLIREGRVPPALVFGNPMFLPPCHGMAVPRNAYLHFIAFDLARAPNGEWWVLRDRTRAPSGAGFALENRIVTSQGLSSAFAGAHVERLASFFRRFSENFLSLGRQDEPLVVVLSPTARPEAYFEHAYLAQYLGYSIVEGADLTVRDNRVYLKTVEGLKPVDLIFRRIDSDLADPLELRADSLVGVPGLLSAVRAGNVIVGNALGSGLVENEAFMAFLPGLNRYLFGDELALKGIASWWCGQTGERDYVLQNLDRLLVRRVSSRQSILGPSEEVYFGAELSSGERADLAARIREAPGAFVGQETFVHSSTPVWSANGGLEAARLTLRVYLAAAADGYVVMPGGLTRVSERYESPTVRNDVIELSKDTWILADGPVDTFSMLATAGAPSLRRGARDLPSRAADNLFWLGRYCERTEGGVRLYRMLLQHLSGQSGWTVGAITIEKLLALLVAQGHVSARRAKRIAGLGAVAFEAELWTLLFDPESPDGLANMLQNVARISNLVRERLSGDTWMILSELTALPERGKRQNGQSAAAAIALLNTMIRHLAAFNGMVMENMTRGLGWRFLEMGRRLERSGHALRLLRQLATRKEPDEAVTLLMLLELADSSMTYRMRYKSAPEISRTLDLLIADSSNPRSIAYQLEALERFLKSVEREEDDAIPGPAERILLTLRSEFALADMSRIAYEGAPSGQRRNLERMLRRAESHLNELAQLIARRYFSHSIAQRDSGPQWTGPRP